MSNFLLETVKIVSALPPIADRFNTGPDTTPLKLKDFAKVLFILQQGAGGTGASTIIAKAASDASKTGATAIPFKYVTLNADAVSAFQAGTTAGISTVAGANSVTAIEIDVRDCPDGKNWVFLDLTESVDSPVDAGIVAILHSPRYQGNPTTVLS